MKLIKSDCFMPYSLIVALLGAFLLSQIFFPGIMSRDSINQYGQAVTGHYTDWHPPLMAFLLALLLKAGGSLHLMIFFQCLTGLLGLRALILLITAQKNFSGWRVDLSVCALMLVFLSPMTPFSFYLVTFWKDVWLLIILLWMSVVLVDIFTRPQSALALYIKSGVYLLLTGFAMLVRANALVIFPLAVLAMWFILRKRQVHWVFIWALSCVPLIFYGSFNWFQYAILQAERMAIDRVIYASDLLGMAHLEPAILAELPFTRQNLHEEYLDQYAITDLSVMVIFAENNFVYPDFYAPVNLPQLRAEFFKAIWHHPSLWIRVKAITFMDFIDPVKGRYAIHQRIEPNEYGLQLRNRLRLPRKLLFDSASLVQNNELLRLFSFVHLPWLLLNGIGVVFLLFNSPKNNHLQTNPLLWILLIALAYYGSYVLVVTSPDFRFMYPATLLTQVGYLSLLGQLLNKRFGSVKNKVDQNPG